MQNEKDNLIKEKVFRWKTGFEKLGNGNVGLKFQLFEIFCSDKDVYRIIFKGIIAWHFPDIFYIHSFSWQIQIQESQYLLRNGGINLSETTSFFL